MGNQKNLKGMKMRTKTLELAVRLLGKMDHFEVIKKMDLVHRTTYPKGMSLIMPMILGALADSCSPKRLLDMVLS